MIIIIFTHSYMASSISRIVFFFLFKWHIYLCGLFNAKAIIKEETYKYNWPIAAGEG